MIQAFGARVPPPYALAIAEEKIVMRVTTSFQRGRLPFLAATLAVIALALAAVLLARPAAAAGHTYCAGSGGGMACGDNPGDNDLSLQQALALAGSGDVILVSAGNHGSITLNASITIIGGYPGGVNGWFASTSSTSTEVTTVGVDFGAVVTLSKIVITGDTSVA